MKKIALEFKEREYTRAMNAFIDYKKSIIEVMKSAKDLKVDITEAEIHSEDNLYSYICNSVYNQASKGSTLPEGINKVKFLDLLDIDLKPLSNSVNTFNRLKGYNAEPKKEDFTRYLQEKDLEVYTQLKDVVDTLNDLADKNFLRNKMAITNAFANMITIDTTNNKLRLNV